jgi:hypothetical protein
MMEGMLFGKKKKKNNDDVMMYVTRCEMPSIQ